MKKIVLMLISSLFLTSCSLTLGGIVALDNETNTGDKIIENYKDLKPNQKVKIEFLNKTQITGLFEASGESHVLIKDEKSELDTFKISEISKIYSINESGSVLTAVAIGAVVDVIFIIIINNGMNFGFALFH